MEEVLSHDVVEHILERVPVKSLIRFKQVSKKWKSTIESKNFRKRQLVHRQQSRGQDILFLHDFHYIEHHHNRNIPSSSSIVIPINFPTMNRFVCITSCDGLVCLYDVYALSIVFNPATTWHRTLPLSNLQRCKYPLFIMDPCQFPQLGFGKDKFNDTYKPVWLYNSREHNDTITTCEVFDFSTKAWRYVTPASPYEIISASVSMCVDGSLHWFTKCEETKILSFDLHTENFQVIAKAPFVYAHYSKTIMCNLNNRLCVSGNKLSNQVIWSFDSGSKTWNQLYTVDWTPAYSWFAMQVSTYYPLAVLEEKNKLLFYDFDSCRELVIHDVQTKSFHLAFSCNFTGHPLCYFQSLISIE